MCNRRIKSSLCSTAQSGELVQPFMPPSWVWALHRQQPANEWKPSNATLNTRLRYRSYLDISDRQNKVECILYIPPALTSAGDLSLLFKMDIFFFRITQRVNVPTPSSFLPIHLPSLPPFLSTLFSNSSCQSHTLWGLSKENRTVLFTILPSLAPQSNSFP